MANIFQMRIVDDSVGQESVFLESLPVRACFRIAEEDDTVYMRLEKTSGCSEYQITVLQLDIATVYHRGERLKVIPISASLHLRS